MDENPVTAAHTLAKNKGYLGTEDDFKNLLSENRDAFNLSYNQFKELGYEGDEKEFSDLLGVKSPQPSEPVDEVVEEDIANQRRSKYTQGQYSINGTSTTKEDLDAKMKDPAFMSKVKSGEIDIKAQEYESSTGDIVSTSDGEFTVDVSGTITRTANGIPTQYTFDEIKNIVGRDRAITMFANQSPIDAVIKSPTKEKTIKKYNEQKTEQERIAAQSPEDRKREKLELDTKYGLGEYYDNYNTLSEELDMLNYQVKELEEKETPPINVIDSLKNETYIKFQELQEVVGNITAPIIRDNLNKYISEDGEVNPEYTTTDYYGFTVVDREKVLENLDPDKERIANKNIEKKYLNDIENAIQNSIDIPAKKVNEETDRLYKEEYGESFDDALGDVSQKEFNKRYGNLVESIESEYVSGVDSTNNSISNDIEQYQQRLNESLIQETEKIKTEYNNLLQQPAVTQADADLINSKIESLEKERIKIADSYIQQETDYIADANARANKINNEFLDKANESLNTLNQEFSNEFEIPKELLDNYNSKRKSAAANVLAETNAYKKSVIQQDNKTEDGQLPTKQKEQYGRIITSTLSSLGGSMYGLTTAMGYDLPELKRMEQYFTPGVDPIAGFKDLNTYNIQEATGNLVGSMIPSLAASMGTAAVTRNLSASARMFLVAFAGFSTETADLSGRAYREALSRTGSKVIADKAVDETVDSQLILAPSYLLGSKLYTGGWKKIFGKELNLGGRVLVGAGAEFTEEGVLQEYPQQLFEEAIKERGEYEAAPEFASVEKFEGVMANVSPVMLLGGAGALSMNAIGKFETAINNYPELSRQELIDFVYKNGKEKAAFRLSALRANGVLDKSTTESMYEYVESIDLNNSQEYTAIKARRDNLIQQKENETDDIKQKVINKQISELETELENIIEGKETKIEKVTIGGVDFFIDPIASRTTSVVQDLNNVQEEIDKSAKEETTEQPTYDKPTVFTTPTSERYGTVNRQDGKGEVALTEEEYNNEVSLFEQPTTETTTEETTEQASKESSRLQKRIDKAKSDFASATDIGGKVKAVTNFLNNATASTASVSKEDMAWYKASKAELEAEGYVFDGEIGREVSDSEITEIGNRRESDQVPKGVIIIDRVSKPKRLVNGKQVERPIYDVIEGTGTTAERDALAAEVESIEDSMTPQNIKETRPKLAAANKALQDYDAANFTSPIQTEINTKTEETVEQPTTETTTEETVEETPLVTDESGEVVTVYRGGNPASGVQYYTSDQKLAEGIGEGKGEGVQKATVRMANPWTPESLDVNNAPQWMQDWVRSQEEFTTVDEETMAAEEIPMEQAIQEIKDMQLSFRDVGLWQSFVNEALEHHDGIIAFDPSEDMATDKKIYITKSPEQVVTEETTEDTTEGKKEITEVKSGTHTSSNPIKIFKGLGGKVDLNGVRINAHEGAKGVFTAVDEDLAKEYAKDKGMSETTLPAGTTFEVVEVDGTGMTPGQYRAAEVKAINDSKADVVKLITVDGKIKAGTKKQEQYVIKNEKLIEDAIQEQAAGKVPVEEDVQLSEVDFKASIYDEVYEELDKEGIADKTTIELELNQRWRDYKKQNQKPEVDTPPSPVRVEESLEGYDGIFAKDKTQGSGLTDPLQDDVRGKKGYFLFQKDTDVEVVMMSPDEYLRRVREGFGTSKDEMITDAQKERIKSAVEKGDKIDMPYLDYRKGRFTQEGRNRAQVAKELGEEFIPVLIARDATKQDKNVFSYDVVSAAKESSLSIDEYLSKYYNNDAVASIKKSPAYKIAKKEEQDAIQEQTTGKEEVSEEEVTKTTDPVQQAKDNLSAAWETWKEQQKKLGVVFDPQSKADEDIALARAIIDYLKAVGANTIKDIKIAVKDFTNNEVKLNNDGLDYLLKVSRKENIDEKVKKGVTDGVPYVDLEKSLKREGYPANEIKKRYNAFLDSRKPIAQQLDNYEKEFEESRNKQREKAKLPERIVNSIGEILKATVDPKIDSKKIFRRLGTQSVLDRMQNLYGTSGTIKFRFTEAYDKIYKGLSSKDTTTLDKIIQLRRFIAIDKNKRKKGLPKIENPGYITGEQAQKLLNELQERIGQSKFLDLNKRADTYFNEFRGILDRLQDASIITKELRDELYEIDYQPRKFLNFILEADSRKKTKNEEAWKTGVREEIIKKLETGSAEELFNNSEWLLSTALSQAETAIVYNKFNINLAKALSDLKSKYDTAKSKGIFVRTKADRKLIAEYKRSKDSMILNPNIGVDKNGNPKYKFDTVPDGFSVVNYKVDGVPNQIFIKDEIYNEVYNINKTEFISPKWADRFSTVSGAKLLRTMATGANPAFVLGNLPNDIGFALTFEPAYSSVLPKAMAQLSKDFKNAVVSMQKKDQTYRDFVEYGGMMDFLYTEGALDAKNTTNSYIDKAFGLFTDEKLFKEKKEAIGNALTYLNQMSEVGIRLGVYNRVFDQEMRKINSQTFESEKNKQEAIEDAKHHAVARARNLIDFSQGGTVVKELNKQMPYLNAAFQALYSASQLYYKNPVRSTLIMAQAAGAFTSGTMLISYGLIAALKSDDEDEEEIGKIYYKTLDGISDHTKRKYFVIPTGVKNSKGNYEYIKIKKTQNLTPIFTLTEHYTNNAIREQLGLEKESEEKLKNNIYDAISDDIDPTGLFNPNVYRGGEPVKNAISQLVNRNPGASALMVLTTGYDPYRNKFIDKFDDYPELAGYDDPNVQDFYKDLSFISTPARLKTATEKIITNPNTNPFVGAVYAFADVTTKDKEVISLITEPTKGFMKGMTGRMMGETSPYIKDFEQNENLREKLVDIEKERMDINMERDDIIQKYISKEINKKQLNEKAKKLSEKLDIEDRKSLFEGINKRIANPNIPSFYFSVAYSDEFKNDPEKQALKIVDKFGEDILDNPTNYKEMQKTFNKIGFKIGKELRLEIVRLVNPEGADEYIDRKINPRKDKNYRGSRKISPAI